MKFLILGLDGATWDLIKLWAKEGKLPTLKELMEKGVWGKLESTIPCESVPAWPALFTGKNPGKINVFHFIKDIDTFEFNKSTDIKSKTIWDYLSDNNLTSCVINLPLTYPPTRLKGIMVTGFLTPQGKTYTYPKELTHYLDSLGYKIDLIFGDKYGEFINEHTVFEKRYELLPEIISIMSKRIEVMHKILHTYDPSFFIINFKMVDVIQHLFWDKKNEILKIYKMIDDELENFLNSDTILFLVSDHGFEDGRNKIFNLREWLLREGYISESVLKRVLIRIAVLLRLYNKNIVQKIYKMFKYSNKAKNSGNPEFKPFLYHGLYVGTKELKKKLVKELRSIKDPDSGEKIFAQVFDVEEVYSGSYVNNAPDILFLANKGYKIDFSGDHTLYKNHKCLPGGHEYSRNGIFLAYGLDIKKGYKIENAKIYDIVPTILHVFGLPIPKDVDGRVLKEIFEENSEFAKRKVIYHENGYEEKKIREKIRELKRVGKI